MLRCGLIRLHITRMPFIDVASCDNKAGIVTSLVVSDTGKWKHSKRSWKWHLWVCEWCHQTPGALSMYHNASRPVFSLEAQMFELKWENYDKPEANFVHADLPCLFLLGSRDSYQIGQIIQYDLESRDLNVTTILFLLSHKTSLLVVFCIAFLHHSN